MTQLRLAIQREKTSIQVLGNVIVTYGPDSCINKGKEGRRRKKNELPVPLLTVNLTFNKLLF